MRLGFKLGNFILSMISGSSARSHLYLLYKYARKMSTEQGEEPSPALVPRLPRSQLGTSQRQGQPCTRILFKSLVKIHLC
jgi:hypothetical protein